MTHSETKDGVYWRFLVLLPEKFHSLRLSVSAVTDERGRNGRWISPKLHTDIYKYMVNGTCTNHTLEILRHDHLDDKG